MTRGFSPPIELVMAASAFVHDPAHRPRLAAACAALRQAQGDLASLEPLRRQLLVACERACEAPPGDIARARAGIAEVLARIDGRPDDELPAEDPRVTAWRDRADLQ